MLYILCYWNRWLSSSKHYCTRSNFITSNAYSCIELNAHALIIFLCMLCDNTDVCDGSSQFLPWLLGSQPCEKAFRAVRSMTSVFSTMINFSMLGLLHHLHHLQIQLQLEAQHGETGIEYPRNSAHKVKEGHHDSDQTLSTNLQHITDEQINTPVQQAKLEASEAANSLGMFVEEKWDELLDENEKDKDDEGDDEDDDEVDTIYDETPKELEELKTLNEIQIQSDCDNLTKDVLELQKVGMVDKKFVNNIKKMHENSFKRIHSSTIPKFEPTEPKLTNDKTQSKHSPLLEVRHNGKMVHVRKTTLVWLFQQGESVSTDRLFQVRNKQPYSTSIGQEDKTESSNSSDNSACDLPQVCKNIEVGDICVFKNFKTTPAWRLGKVLQFCYFQGKSMKIQQYKGLSVSLDRDCAEIGVLCSWFDWHPPKNLCTFSLANLNNSTHEFIPLDSYVCTISEGCFDDLEANSVEGELTSIITTANSAKANLISSKCITLSERALSHIEKYIPTITISSSEPLNIKENEIHNTKTKKDKTWKQYGYYKLTESHKSQLSGGQLLDDIHIDAAQTLLKQQFPEIGGLCNTLLQNSSFNNTSIASCPSLQIAFVPMNKIGHWIVLSTLGCKENEIEVYDTLQDPPSLDTQITISRYMKSKSSSITKNK